jgi:hypothetical protein
MVGMEKDERSLRVMNAECGMWLYFISIRANRVSAGYNHSIALMDSSLQLWLDAEWQKLLKKSNQPQTPPGVMWSYQLTPPFPSAWPPSSGRRTMGWWQGRFSRGTLNSSGGWRTNDIKPCDPTAFGRANITEA